MRPRYQPVEPSLDRQLSEMFDHHEKDNIFNVIKILC